MAGSAQSGGFRTLSVICRAKLTEFVKETRLNSSELCKICNLGNSDDLECLISLPSKSFRGSSRAVGGPTATSHLPSGIFSPGRVLTPAVTTPFENESHSCAFTVRVSHRVQRQPPSRRPLRRLAVHVYVLGNMQESNVDAEGRVAVGGNATLTNYGVGSKLSGSPGNSLVVAGDLAYNGGGVHHGNIVYGGSLSGSFGVPNGSITHGSAIDFAAGNSYLLGASVYWSGLAANASTIDYYGGVHLVGSNADLKCVLAHWCHALQFLGRGDRCTRRLHRADQCQRRGGYVPLHGHPVPGSEQRWHRSNKPPERDLQLLRRPPRSNSTESACRAASTAPKATVNFNNGNVEGNLIAGNLIGTGEAHNYLFQE